ncbi:MAG: oligosaccharide flippase family protein [Candidatus Neomarinimicrobiota bacterium]
MSEINPAAQDPAVPPGDEVTVAGASLSTDILNLGRQSLAYVVGHLATRAVSFLLLPLYTNALAPAEMGILSLAFAFSAFGLIVFNLGLDSALMRYYVGEPKNRQREVLATVYFSLVLVGLVLSAILLSLSPRLATGVLAVDRPDWITILIAIMFLDTLWTVPMHLFRAHQRPASYIIFSLLNVSITMGLNILLVAHYRLGVEGALLANLAASGTLFVLSLPATIRWMWPLTYSFATLRTLLRFGLPLLVAGLFTMTIELADRYFLRWLTDLQTVGIYSAGYKLGLLMLIVVMGFTLGWQPFLLRRGKEAGARQVFARIATYLVAIMATLLLTAAAWVDELVRLPLGRFTLFGQDYWSSTPIVPIVMLGYLFFGLYVLLMPGILLAERTRWVILFRFSGAATNVGLNLMLIPILGAMGAAVATCVSFAVMALFTFLIIQRVYPIPFEWGRLARIAALVTLGLLLLYGLEPSLGRDLALTFLVPLGLWLSGALTPEERRTVRHLVRRS